MRSIRLLALVLCVLPSVAAEPIDGSIEHHGTTTLTGAVDLTTQAAAFWREPTSPIPWSAQVEFTDGKAWLYNVPTHHARIHDPQGPREVSNGTLPFTEAEVVWNGTADHLTAAGDDGTLRILPRGTTPRTFRLHASTVEVGPAAPAPERLQDGTITYIDQIHGHPVRPSGLQAPVSTPSWPTLELEGPLVAFVVADHVELDGRTLRTGTHANPSQSLYDPATRSGLHARDNLVLVIEFEAARVAVNDGPGWALAGRSISGNVDGSATWRDVEAAVQAGGQELPHRQHVLTMEGEFAFDATLQEGRTHWHVTGDVARVLVDTVPVLEVAALAGAASLSLLALAALLFTEPGRALLASLVGRTSPRLSKAKLLGDNTRRDLLKIINEHQPLRLKDLVQKSPLARNTIRYHLRVLHAHDVVQTAWSGDLRGRAYMLNSGSFMFDTPGLAADPPKTLRPGPVLAVARGHPLRWDLFKTILEHGPVDFAQIRPLLADQHPSLAQSTASRHLQILEREQAIRAYWDQGRKKYCTNIDPTQARRQQYLGYLEHHGYTAIVHVLLRRGPATTDEVARWLRAGPRTTHQTLCELVGLGLLDTLPRRRFEVTPFLASAIGEGGRNA